MPNYHTIDPLPVLLGWDAREQAAYEVAEHSLLRHAGVPLDVRRLLLPWLQRAGLYTRPTVTKDGHFWDTISAAPMATAFALSRFWLPWLVNGREPGQRARQGWAVFADGDVLFRRDIGELLRLADPRYAVQVVKHVQAVGLGERKMEGQPQLAYPRKNWSSVMLWNLAHPAHEALTLELLNAATGRELHAFCWLQDAEIGSLPLAWNWLEGQSDPLEDPALVHFTRGGPWLAPYQDVEFAREWREEAGRAFALLHRRALL